LKQRFARKKHRMLRKYKGYLFDLDGVIYLGPKVIPGVIETLEELNRLGKRIYFVTNDSVASFKESLANLKARGIPVTEDQLIISTRVTAQYLSTITPRASAFVVGSKGLIEELTSFGIDAKPATDLNPPPVDYLIAGHFTELNYTYLTCALRTLIQGAKFIALNRDPTVPTNEGLVPGLGAIVGAIEGMTGHKPDLVIGKPETILLEKVLTSSGLIPQDCVMIGDTLEVDVAAGIAVGMDTVLVRSGNQIPEFIPKTLVPTYIIPSVASLLDDHFG
jgi:HAD superfamily hydrolase (TIGR01450 family)